MIGGLATAPHCSFIPPGSPSAALHLPSHRNEHEAGSGQGIIDAQ
jgi:hypothetical protein